MGQIEVYEWLKEQRKIIPEEFFTVKQICGGLKAVGCNGSTRPSLVGLHCAKLEADGYLEVVRPGKYNNWRRSFRIKKKFIKG